MNSDYQRITKAINYLQKHAQEQPSLEQLATACNLSPYHFQRLFRRWAGVSPKQFLQFLTVGHARQLLESSTPVLDASFEVGLSSPGRLHDHFVKIEAVTPGDVKRKGEGMTIVYGQSDGPFGTAFVAMTERGICALQFLGEQTIEKAAAELADKWSGAELRLDNSEIKNRFGAQFPANGKQKEIKVLVQGTNFQVQVWQALLKIPQGHLCSYGQLATYIGKPDATRAVASAIGANSVAWLIPCHRVLRTGGALGGYRWGLPRKQAMLAWEFAKPAHSAVAKPKTTDKVIQTSASA